MSVFLNYGFLNISIIEFDNEDNIYRTEKTPWEQNLDMETFEPLSDYGLRYYAVNKIWFKTKKAARSIRLNNFKFPYSVRKVSDHHFELRSAHFQQYFDEGDNISVIVKF